MQDVIKSVERYKIIVLNANIIKEEKFNFFSVYLFLRERERAPMCAELRAGEKQRERETLSEAGSMLSAQNLT